MDLRYLQVHIHMFWLQMPALSIAQMYHNLKSQSDHLSQFPDQFHRYCQNHSRPVGHLPFLLVWRQK